jgi:hypothetical protein
VGYAAEYLTRGRFSAIPMGRFPLMFIYCILYHFWDVCRILLPPPRQFRTPLATARPCCARLLALLVGQPDHYATGESHGSAYSLGGYARQPTIFFPLLARGRTDDGGRRTEDCGATSAPYRFRVFCVFRGSNLCVLCVLCG